MFNVLGLLKIQFDFEDNLLSIKNSEQNLKKIINNENAQINISQSLPNTDIISREIMKVRSMLLNVPHSSLDLWSEYIDITDNVIEYLVSQIDFYDLAIYYSQERILYKVKNNCTTLPYSFSSYIVSSFLEDNVSGIKRHIEILDGKYIMGEKQILEPIFKLFQPFLVIDNVIRSV